MRRTRGILLFMASVMGMTVSFTTGDTLTKEFMHKVKPAAAVVVRPFELTDVQLLDGPFKKAMGLNSQWLLSLEPDRFLAWFRKEAGLDPKGRVYGGWERETIAGHSLGHYMTAIALMYGQTGQQEFKDRAAYIVDELAAVQEAHGSGYMSAFPNGKKAFDEIVHGEIRSQGFDLNGIWVPWYTQHKLMAGLRDIYHYTGNPKALAVWIRHADWIEGVTANLTDELWQKMLACEHGGINETFADLYGITGDARYLRLAEKFYHKSVLDPLSRREDSLSGLHANTQVPKIIGAARLYELTGQDRFKTIADFFWTTVVNHYSYANGGNSAEEYFGKPDHLAERMHHTTETCNTYNMLLLTRHLFAWQPSAAYMDYYERALFNHILTHQHPEEGGRLVYKGFLDMPAQKGFSDPTESFWCCVGTGMENHAKYADTIYAYSPESLYVNLFISSQLMWKEKNITLTQKTQLPVGDAVNLAFSCPQPAAFSLKIRKPYWAKSVEMALNGKSQTVTLGPDGYITIDRTFTNNDEITLKFPLRLHTSTLPDMPDRTAFLYGPTLLAALLEEGQNPPSLVAQDATALLEFFERREPLAFHSDKVAYRLTEGGWQQCGLTLMPLFAIAEQPYTVYMDTFTPETWRQKQAEYAAEQKRLRQIEAVSADVLRLGQMQAERDHNLNGERTNIGSFNGRKWRDSYDGWFEFEMKVRPEEPMEMICTYWGSERGRRKFDILVDGTTIATQELNRNKPNDFFDAIYPIPVELTQGKEKVRVRIQAHPNNYAGGVFEVRTVVRDSAKPAAPQATAAGAPSQLAKDYPFEPVPFTQVHFDDVFWAPRLETNRSVTIPYAFEKCEESKRFYHFERAAKVLRGETPEDLSAPGLPFDDTDPYKVLEGASFGLSVKYDAQMDAYLDKVIALIASAQEPDGYLYTTRTINPQKPHEWAGTRRWVNVKQLSHELYNMGHLYEAAAAHYQATGKRTLLDVALKNADLLYETFGPGKNEDAPGHQIIEMGLVKLYRITGKEKYLNLARFFLDTRGPGNGEYSQAHQKVVDQDEAVGHAVRAVYMYSGMADVAALTGDQAYLRAMDRIWDNMVSKKLYITGGIGATASGEAFGPNYVLPNMSGYCETCAAIGSVYWNQRMFLLHGQSRYIDVVERTLYNGLLSGISLEGKNFFYPNPLESRGQHNRAPWFGCACCPGNIARFLASVPGYVYAKKDNAVYVNLFVGGTGWIQLADTNVALRQETKYPWDGHIKMAVTPEKQTAFAIHIRIPGWAMNTPVPGDLYSYTDNTAIKPTLSVNDASVPVNPVNGYVILDRQWNTGDTIELELPMPIRKVVAHEKVVEDRHRIALERGPIVYCLEGADHPDKQVRSFIFNPSSEMKTEYRPELLGGVQVLTGVASIAALNDEGKAVAASEVKITAIPYYAWCNRGPNEMVVWLPTRIEDVFVKPRPTIASQSRVTASRGSGRAGNIVDQVVPKSSHDKDEEFYHWWPKKGTQEWVQFEFEKPQALSAIEVYWLDDTGHGECKVPQSWKLMYRDGQDWKQVVDGNGYGTELNMFNRTSFTEVITSAIRLEIQMQSRWSAGILEVRLE